MTYDDAKKIIMTKRMLGLPILFLASLSSSISALKMFYFGLDNGDQFSAIMMQPIKSIVYLIYSKTRFLDFFWSYSPTPIPRDFFSSENITCFFIYLLIFVGMTLIKSAHSLSLRITKIDKEIEDSFIRDSVKGIPVRKRQDVQDQITVPASNSQWYTQFHSMYLAPIIVGLIVAAIAKLAGLV
jgi:hypothetical protein